MRSKNLTAVAVALQGRSATVNELSGRTGLSYSTVLRALKSLPV